MSVLLVGPGDQTATGSLSANYLVVGKFVASASGTVDYVRIYASSDGNMKLGLYADSSGSPGTLLTTQASQAVTTGYCNLSFPAYSIVNGTTYWLAGNGSVNAPARNSPNGTTWYKALTFADAFPDPAGTGFTENNNVAGWEFAMTLYGTDSSSGIKTVMGLAKASVKTINDLAIASVKTINGLA